MQDILCKVTHKELMEFYSRQKTMVHNGIANPKTVIRKLHQKFPMTVLGFYSCICLDRLQTRQGQGSKIIPQRQRPTD